MKFLAAGCILLLLSAAMPAAGVPADDVPAAGAPATTAPPASAPTPQPPVLAAKSAVSLDLDTDEIIFTRSIDERVYPASTTKVLTAILLVESVGENPESLQTLSYSAAAKATHPYSLDLPVGDTLTVDAVLDALLLYSANDVAVMIAENVAGSIPAFAERMNAKARELGMQNSRFTNPHGLHHQEHYTTAYDLSLLGRALISYPQVMAAMARREARIESGSGLAFAFENRNKLAGTNGCLVGKTGYTDEAGRCLVAIYERNGRRIAGVVMSSEYDREDTVVFRDMEALMDWSYSAQREMLYPSGEPIGQVNTEVKLIPGIGPKRDFAVPVSLRKAVWVYASDEEKETKVEIPPIDPWRLRRDSPVGDLVVLGRLSITRSALYPTVSASEILSAYRLFYILLAAGVLAFSGTLTSLILLRRAKRRLSG